MTEQKMHSLFARLRFRARRRWIYSVRPRIARREAIASRLPWRAWCWLCGWDAGVVVAELARRSGRPLCFVQIGSNDGSANDPLQPSVRAHGWTGVLVEPIPAIYERLRATYAGVDGLTFANTAIGTDAGRATLYTVDVRPGDPEWADQIASLDRDHVLTHAYAMPDIGDRIVAIDVDCVTLPTLVERQGLSRVDLMHVDAEGLDAEIIGQVPLGASWAPTYLLFEKKHMALDVYRAVRERLRSGGYRLLDLGPDEFAYRSAPARTV